jgi:hypothetical protein
MRALILVASAALALSACSKNEAADNAMNDTMTTNEVLVNDTAMNADMNTVDANMTMNAADTANAAADTANAAADTANAAANNAQ